MRTKTDINLDRFLTRAPISAEERGNISENKVKRALDWLKRKLLIIDYMHVSEIRALDKRKIDFIVVTIKGACYKFTPLQVKSSEIGLMKHKSAMRRIKKGGIRGMFSNIPAIIVNKRDSIEDLCIKILKIIS
ncbi:MAG: hypothetical protein U9P63_00155 [Patescibacteria group bacterium]|nr:hypothetical protein [Patescibacteria group bacterium]